MTSALVTELAYVEIESTHPESWERFGCDLLDMTARGGRRGIRQLKLDTRPYRLSVHPGTQDRLLRIGWLTHDATALSKIELRLARAGVVHRSLSEEECDDRGVTSGITFNDPDQFTHDVVTGIEVDAEPTAGPNVSGYVADDLGLGHIVLAVDSANRSQELFGSALGMELREELTTPMGRGLFFGCNARHHSIAVVEMGEAAHVLHFMLEMRDLDDVGVTLDRALDQQWRVTKTLGRHYTDHMLSFYMETPAGFEIEIGSNGVLADNTWDQTKLANRKRAWGHHDG